MNPMKTTFAALALSVAALPAAAQNVNANNLISVDISNVANDIARNLSVDVQDVIDIGAIQVPVGIAANVCNVSAAVLAQGGDAGGRCEAGTTSQALNQAVGRMMQ